MSSKVRSHCSTFQRQALCVACCPEIKHPAARPPHDQVSSYCFLRYSAPTQMVLEIVLAGWELPSVADRYVSGPAKSSLTFLVDLCRLPTYSEDEQPKLSKLHSACMSATPLYSYTCSPNGHRQQTTPRRMIHVVASRMHANRRSRHSSIQSHAHLRLHTSHVYMRQPRVPATYANNICSTQ